VVGLIEAMNKQIAGMQQQQIELLRELTDKQRDQALVKEKIDKDFDFRVMNMLAQLEAKFAKISADTERSVQTQIGARLAEMTRQIEGALSRQPAAPQAPAPVQPITNVHLRQPMGRRVTKRDKDGRAEQIEEFLLNSAAPAPTTAGKPQ
jgi:hypothetical protein